MSTRSLGICAVIALASVTNACRADDEPAAEIAKLRTQIAELRAENLALRAELARLKGSSDKTPASKADAASVNADLRRLLDLDKAMTEKAGDESLRKDAAALATRLAPDLPGNHLVWRVLLKTKVLRDGLSLAEAEKLLGPATDKSDKLVGWYFNPNHRMHVAPYLYAKVTKDGLAEWKLVNR